MQLAESCQEYLGAELQAVPQPQLLLTGESSLNQPCQDEDVGAEIPTVEAGSIVVADDSCQAPAVEEPVHLPGEPPASDEPLGCKEQLLLPDAEEQPKPKRQKRALGPRQKALFKQYAVVFKGNDSARWDKKEVWLDGEWLEDMFGENELFPGRVVQIPFGNTPWQAVVSRVPDEQESSQMLTGSVVGDKPEAASCSSDQKDASQPQPPRAKKGGRAKPKKKCIMESDGEQDTMLGIPPIKRGHNAERAHNEQECPQMLTGSVVGDKPEAASSCSSDQKDGHSASQPQPPRAKKGGRAKPKKKCIMEGEGDQDRMLGTPPKKRGRKPRSPKKESKAKRAAGKILSVGKKKDSPDEPQHNADDATSNMEQVLSRLSAQQDKIVDILSLLVTPVAPLPSHSDRAGVRSSAQSSIPDQSASPTHSSSQSVPFCRSSLPGFSDPPPTLPSDHSVAPLLDQSTLPGHSAPPPNSSVLSGQSSLSDHHAPPHNSSVQSSLSDHHAPPPNSSVQSGQSSLSGHHAPPPNSSVQSGQSSLAGHYAPPPNLSMQSGQSSLSGRHAPPPNSSVQLGQSLLSGRHAPPPNSSVQLGQSSLSSHYAPPPNLTSQSAHPMDSVQSGHSGPSHFVTSPHSHGALSGESVASSPGPSSYSSRSVAVSQTPSAGSSAHPYRSTPSQSPHSVNTIASPTSQSISRSVTSPPYRPLLPSPDPLPSSLPESLTEDWDFFTDDDSDYLTSSQWNYSGDAETSGTASPVPVPRGPKNIPPPPFATPPKLQSVEQVMRAYPGKDVATLRKLATALARDAIFGREEMVKKSLTGRKDTEMLDKLKLDYIKTLVHSRVPNKSSTEFEEIWKWCRSSLSKSCQTLRSSARKKSIDF